MDLLEAIDREMDLGIETGGPFQGFLRVQAPEETATGDDPSQQVLEATSFDDFRKRCGEMASEPKEIPKEIHVQLGRPAREPLREHGMKTESIEVLVFPSLRMVDVGDMEQARLVCPSCGERSHFDAAFSVRPDPRFYCGRCGGLTPLPDTRFAVGDTDEGIPFPCYRSVVLFDAEVEAPGDSVLAPVPGVLGIQALEGALGCGLRAVVVGSPRRAHP
jgi:ribosomal protein S27AE